MGAPCTSALPVTTRDPRRHRRVGQRSRGAAVGTGRSRPAGRHRDRVAGVGARRSGHAGGGHTFDLDYGAGDAGAALAAAIATAVGPEAVAASARRVVCSPPARPSWPPPPAPICWWWGRAGGFRSLLLGSVSEQCLHHTTGPLAIVPAGSRRMRRRGGWWSASTVPDSSGRALRWSARGARLRHARVDVVHVAAAHIVPAPRGDGPRPRARRGKAARELLDRLVDGGLGREPALVERLRSGARRPVPSSTPRRAPIGWSSGAGASAASPA
jgi:nucleotide-binding universal stress UspA family protein